MSAARPRLGCSSLSCSGLVDGLTTPLALRKLGMRQQIRVSSFPRSALAGCMARWQGRGGTKLWFFFSSCAADKSRKCRSARCWQSDGILLRRWSGLDGRPRAPRRRIERPRHSHVGSIERHRGAEATLLEDGRGGMGLPSPTPASGVVRAQSPNRRPGTWESFARGNPGTRDMRDEMGGVCLARSEAPQGSRRPGQEQRFARRGMAAWAGRAGDV